MTQNSTDAHAETYAAKRTRWEAEADALRKRGSKLARKLIALYRAVEDAQRPIDKKVTQARLTGACDALAALHGYTPDAWMYAVLMPYRAAEGTRPIMSHAPGGNLGYLTWEAELAVAVDDELFKLGLVL